MSTLALFTNDNISIKLLFDDPRFSGQQQGGVLVPLGRCSPAANGFQHFTQRIPVRGVRVENPALVTSATFRIIVFGDAKK